MAFTFILGPSQFQQLAQADTLYQNLSTNGWGQTDRTIDYTYDDNGSLLSKTTRETSTSTVQERVDYQYNYQGRLCRVITDLDSASGTNPVDVVDYAYNEAGIRVSAYSFTVAQNYLDTQDEQTYATGKQTTLYLIDAQNPTGYAQVIAELTYNKANPDPATDTPASIRSYTFGDDVIAQKDSSLSDTQFLLYDGHGSTRQLVNASQTIQGSYSYDAYGMMLGGNPTTASPSGTNLLYTGEQYDANLQQYYLRARYYNPSNGRFNRMDDFAGNNSDPQSLHKYLYCHANPINAIDPTGKWVGAIAIGVLNVLSVISTAVSAVAIAIPIIRIGISLKNLVALSGIAEMIRSSSLDMVTQLTLRNQITLLALQNIAAMFTAFGNLVQEVLMQVVFLVVVGLLIRAAFATIGSAIRGVSNSALRVAQGAGSAGDDMMNVERIIR